ncbi:MAG: methionyl-tRNA formyltransferase [Planctomycetota bacterium]|jgi:methionyl-tRNA formyltransferase
MKIAILTANEPFYLPAFFDQFLAHRAKDVVGLCVCAPVYKDQTTWSMLRRYLKTFGGWNMCRLACRVVTAKITGRLLPGRRGMLCSVQAVGKHYGVDVLFPDDVNAPQFHDRLRSLEVDLILSVSCPQIFKDDLIALPAKGCLNLHGADLPEYRGLMPSFWMLANNETQAGVSIFFVNAGIDTGDIAGKILFPIERNDTLDSFIRRSKVKACQLTLDVIEQIENGTVSRTGSEGEGSYYGWPTREAYQRFRKLGRRLW